LNIDADPRFLYDPMFSDAIGLLSTCRPNGRSYYHEGGAVFWIAGQRIDPNLYQGNFVWRVTSTDNPVFGDNVSLMNYTKWGHGSPAYDHSCVYLIANDTYPWLNTDCKYWMCFICELDMALHIE